MPAARAVNRDESPSSALFACPSRSTIVYRAHSEPHVPSLTGVPLAAPLRDNPFLECIPSLSHTADDRQGRTAVPGRHAAGMEHVHGVLSGGAPRRLSVLARDHE